MQSLRAVFQENFSEISRVEADVGRRTLGARHDRHHGQSS